MTMKTPQEIINAFDKPVPAEGGGGGQKFMEEFADENSWIKALNQMIHDYWFKYYMLFNRSVPLRCLEILSEDQDEDIRCRVADREDLTPELIEKLSNDHSGRVRSYLASNHKIFLSEDIINKLANDENEEVRYSIATNDLVTGRLLLKLANDNSPIARKGVINNINTPVEILKKFITDKDVYDIDRFDAEEKYNERLNEIDQKR